MLTKPRPKSGAQPTTDKTPALKLPFTKGAVKHHEPFGGDLNVNLNASAVTSLGTIEVPAIPGFLRAILVDITLVSTGNSATVALSADAPWNVISEITHQDTASNPQFGAMSGYRAYLAHRYGGVMGQIDPRALPDYTALTTGSGATAGSGRFQLRVPVEANARDGFCSLYNSNAAVPFRLKLILNALNQIFTTAPNGTVQAQVRLVGEFWYEPDVVDVYGRPQETVPPANGSTMFWSQFVGVQQSAGLQTFRIQRGGLFWRTLIMEFRNSSGDRAAASVPADLTLAMDTRPLFQQSTMALRLKMAEAFNFATTTADALNGPDTGVVVWSFADEFDGKHGFEMREQYLPTSQGSRLDLQYTLTQATIPTVLVNDIAPAAGVLI